MNYWPAEKGALPETVGALTDWVESIVPSGERTARTFYRAKGWVTHVLGNVWQFTAPGEHPSWALRIPPPLGSVSTSTTTIATAKTVLTSSASTP